MKQSILLCTVGGSHQPIVTAIHALAPAFVCFLCTDRDPATGQPGSRLQVEGKGNVIKAHPTDEVPTLPNIPTQTALAAGAFEVRLVPTDDLDGVVETARRAMIDLRQGFPEAHLVADYTGGTKTMTAGLILAALEEPDVELRLVTGARGDLVKVHDGTQASAAASVDRIRLRRQMAPFLSAWEHFSYGAAALGLAQIPAPRDPELRGQWQIACDLSVAFDAWDRFDHPAALARLALYRARIGRHAGLALKFLEMLCLNDGDRRKEPARLFDLWRNAQRRAAQGRYDDAVARAYRLLEWTAQWLLRSRAAIDTSDIPADRLPPDMVLRPNREGHLQAGLYDAWRLVAHHLDGPAATFARNEAGPMLDHLNIRNTSILAHGFTPIDDDAWERFHGWLEQAFIPVLRREAAAADFRMEPPQLPTGPIWD